MWGACPRNTNPRENSLEARRAQSITSAANTAIVVPMSRSTGWINNFLLPDRDPQSAGPYRKGMQVPNYSARELVLVHSSIAWTSMDCSLTGLLPRYVHWTDSAVAGPIPLNLASSCPDVFRVSQYPSIPICSAHGCGICNSVVCSGWGLGKLCLLE